MPEQQKETEKRPDAVQPFDPTGGEAASDNGASSNGGESRRERRARIKQEKAVAKAAKKAAKEEEKGAADEQAPEQVEAPPARNFFRIGHKGADAIVTGNTIESFEAAVEAGAEMVELDVLRTRDGRLIVAHDHHDAASRRPLSLSDALDAFRFKPLDEVEIDCDLKLPGREAELAGVLAGHGLIERAMVSTMEIESLYKLRSLDPDLRLGWTYPKTRRDWTQDRWAKPVLGAGLYVLKRRLPNSIRERAPEIGVDAVWVYHWLVTPEAVAAAEEAEVELYAWTVDEAERVNELAGMGVHGIVSNDPRILA